MQTKTRFHILLFGLLIAVLTIINIAPSTQAATIATKVHVPTVFELKKQSDDLQKQITTLKQLIILLQEQIKQIIAQQSIASSQITNTQSQIVQSNPIPTINANPPRVIVPDFKNPTTGIIQISRGGDVAWDLRNRTNALKSIELYVDGSLAITDYNPYPWLRTTSDAGHWLLDTTKISNGQHSITIKAYNVNDEMSQDTKTINIQN